MAQWLTVGEAASVLGLSRERIRYLVDARRLRGAVRTPTGRRLIPWRAVEALKAVRQGLGPTHRELEQNQK